jgi:hypothetical protein
MLTKLIINPTKLIQTQLIINQIKQIQTQPTILVIKIISQILIIIHLKIRLITNHRPILPIKQYYQIFFLNFLLFLLEELLK